MAVAGLMEIETAVERIMWVLNKGCDLGSDAWHFIESTFPDASAAELAELMAAGDDVEAAPLIELLFFPDERLRTRLEGLLSSCRPFQHRPSAG